MFEIRTGHLPSISQKHYRLNQLHRLFCNGKNIYSYWYSGRLVHDAMLWSGDAYQRLQGIYSYCLHPQGWSPKVEAVCSSGKLVFTYQTARQCYHPQDHNVITTAVESSDLTRIFLFYGSELFSVASCRATYGPFKVRSPKIVKWLCSYVTLHVMTAWTIELSIYSWFIQRRLLQ
jgi:hypothetical protein